MKRAVLVSSCGDPFLDSLIHRLFKERWYSEVDEFYININNHSQVPHTVIGESLYKLSADPKVHIIYHPMGIGNGRPIAEMLKVCEADLVMLLENDGFIFKPGYVDRYFKMIEEGECDAVGSPRSSCGLEVTEAMVRKYKLDISGFGDKGVNYWPNFFFCKKSHLMQTDHNFASKKFPAGAYFHELDYTFKEDNYADTFCWADIQMRYHGTRFAECPQYHASPEEIEYFDKKQDKWSEGTDIGWIHGGSLSAGWGGYLGEITPDVSTLQAKMEIETRVAFWDIALNATPGFSNKNLDFKTQYANGITGLIGRANLSAERIQRKISIYKNLLQL